MVKTKEEIQKEIEMFKTIRPKVRLFSVFNDDNLAQLDAQVDVLKHDLTNVDIYERYDHAGASEEILSAALDARIWLSGEFDEEHIAEDWPLKSED